MTHGCTGMLGLGFRVLELRRISFDGNRRNLRQFWVDNWKFFSGLFKGHKTSPQRRRMVTERRVKLGKSFLGSGCGKIRFQFSGRIKVRNLTELMGRRQKHSRREKEINKNIINFNCLTVTILVCNIVGLVGGGGTKNFFTKL